MREIPCDVARARLTDALFGAPLDATERAEAEHHAAGCAACAAETAALRDTWTALGSSAPRLPSSEAREHARRALAAARLDAGEVPASRWRGRTMALGALAAGIVLGALIGGAATSRTTAPEAPAPTVAASQQYMILLYTTPRPPSTTPPATPAAPPRPASAASAERMRAIVAEYRAWADSLAREGRLVRAEKLADETRVLPAGRAVTEGAVLGGFYLIRASSYEDALSVARGSPHLKYGGRVVVRGIEGT